MKTFWIGSVALFALGAVGAADAADMAPVYKAQPPAWNWTGSYLGIHVGAAWGETKFSGPLGPGIFGDDVRTPAFLGGGQIGYNWQAPNSPWVFGVEAEISALDSIGTNTCLASSGFFVSANCSVRPDATAAVTGRVGYAIGSEGRTLLYLKAGLAGVHDRIDIATNANLPPLVTGATLWKWGGTIGAGVEQALAPAWSVRLEYDYLGFGSGSVPTPVSFVQTAPPNPASYVITPGSSAGVTLHIHTIKLGLNYRLGGDPWAGWPVASPLYPVKAMITKVPPAAWAGGWEIEAGARYWYSWGRFQKDLGADVTPANATCWSRD